MIVNRKVLNAEKDDRELKEKVYYFFNTVRWRTKSVYFNMVAYLNNTFPKATLVFLYLRYPIFTYHVFRTTKALRNKAELIDPNIKHNPTQEELEEFKKEYDVKLVLTCTSAGKTMKQGYMDRIIND